MQRCLILNTTVMEEKMMNEKESLALISQMIRNTQQRFERVNAAPFLAFGYAAVLVSIMVWFFLTNYYNPYWNLLWFLIPVLGYLFLKLFFPKQEKMVKSFVDKAIDYVWNVIGFTMLFVGVLTIFVNISIMPTIVLLMGIAMTLTGLLAKLPIIKFSGILGILSSALFWFRVVEGGNVILLFAVVFFVFMVLPGHILYAKKEGGAHV